MLFRSGSKLAALQTLRDHQCAIVFAKRLECGELAPAFSFGSGPPEVRKGKIDSESELESMNEQISFICYVRKMSELHVPLLSPREGGTTDNFGMHRGLRPGSISC